MSKPSTAQTTKNPTIPRQSAWSRGPPQSSSSPSRSQSPAPSTPIVQTHSRRPSALSGISIKDGVSVPRSNVGAAKQGSAVTFGSIDDVSAPISSSPATAPSIKTEGVKSFGTIEAETHVNGKSTLSSRPSAAASTSPANSTTSTPAVSVATPTTTAKLAKTDIAKLFQNPSSAPSSQPSSDTSSPSLRTAGLPASQSGSSSQPPPSSTPSQPSQLNPHPFTPYRHPQPNAGSGAPRSPAYPARQVANGSGPRSQGGPNGTPSQINAGMSSPRLATLPHNGQPSGMPPPPQMQPPMAQQLPVGWSPYYYPGVPDSHYYQPTWYPSPHHPPPGGPHGPPHAGIPISPRNPQIPLQGPGTPTLSHASASPAHPPHPPPPMTHPSASMSSISSPPPTPSASSRLNVNSTAFVPPRPKVTLKKADGTEVNIENLSKPSSSPANNASTNGQTSTFRQGSPGTPNRRGVRLESPEQRDKRIAEEERVRAEAEEKVRKERDERERERKQKEEAQRKKEEEEKKKREEKEKKKREEEEKEKERLRKEEEKERIRKEEEEKERIRKEEEEKERLRKEEEEKERIRKEKEERERIRLEEEEKERVRKVEEEKERLLREEEERLRKEKEEQKRKEEEERERLRKEEEEKERLLQEEERAAKERLAQRTKEEVETDSPEEGEIGPISKDTKEEVKDKKEPLRINTSETLKRRPERLDLSNTGSVPAPLPSALATARVIDDLSRVQYPEGISSPNPELNANAKDGKFRYDRDFLLQFMALCKEKPDMLPPLDAIGLEPIDQASLTMTRGGSGRGHRQASGSSTASRSGPIGLGFGTPSGFGKSTGINPFTGGGMGNFSTSGNKLSSEERFQLATARSTSVGGPAGLNFGRPVPMQRTASQGGPGGSLTSHRTRSQRGKQRETNKMGGPAQQAPNTHPNAQGINLEPIVPLKATENRWDRKAIQVEADSPEMVDRKVKGLLNKLTMERFDSISDQIIAWANKSEKEKDGRTLIQVIRLVFEKATDEATWSEMYARLCRKMMEQISNKVQDDGIKTSEGKPIAGGQLFRKYLLNRCQEDFERGWVAKEATAAAAATKALEDQAVKAANEKNKEGDIEEVALYSIEYYAAQKAKRQGLGLIKFIGELFKLQMLTERIMHECVKKLLGNVNNPEEEEIESLCKLLTTVGQLLDTQKAHAHMDVYFQRMKELTKSQNVSPRMQFMLQDVIELRERKWITRNAIAAPSTIAQVHEAAAKEKALHEKEYSQRQVSMSRGGSRRGGDRSDHPQVNPEGWAVAGNAARPPSKAGDLSNFGKISNKALPTTFTPSSVFAGKKVDKRESLSRTSSNSNMFSMLQNTESGTDKTSDVPPQRKRLALLPRTKPLEQAEAQQQQDSSEDEEATGAVAGMEMSEEAAKKKIDEDSKEFFGVRNLDEAEIYFTALPAQYHHKLVDKLVSAAVESKEADAQLVSDLFARAVAKNLCSAVAFEEGFTPVAEIIDDIAIDAPKAFSLFATMIKGAELDEERRSRLASKSMDKDKLLALLS